MNELIELVETTYTDYRGEEVYRCYEVYSVDLVELITSSANAYWHDREWWLKNHPEVTPIREGKFRVMCDGGFIGVWETKEEFYNFLSNYMRATVHETVTI